MSMLAGSMIMLGLFGLGVHTGVRVAKTNQRLDVLIAQALDRRHSLTCSPLTRETNPGSEWVYDEWWKK